MVPPVPVMDGAEIPGGYTVAGGKVPVGCTVKVLEGV